MRELPILFNTDMVRAILDGRKSMTRRPVKKKDIVYANPSLCLNNASPYQVGDNLYVRETWYNWFDVKVLYKSTHPENSPYIKTDFVKWKPSIHMPKKYARIWLEVTNVRVERVQDIDDEQAGKEGMSYINYDGGYCDSGKLIFKQLWNSIYKNWDDNPWVWVYEFKVISKQK